MPRLTKIRIVGCRYDNFRKRHENSIYDLTRDGEPDHTLFTLNNQGGKGVLMQLISQIVMPETRWGKQSGNKITSMFYDQSNRLRPYTFHVIMEWKLETIPDKWLITGICMSAFMRSEEKEEGEDKGERQVGLNYFLYTHEHRGDTYFTVESIPAYYTKDRKAAEYKEFEDFINDNRKYFIKYSQSQAKRLDSDYYNYLRSLGITKPEWEILKLINKVEGGVGDYFSRASDNRSIFDRFIIPAITENMKNYMEEDQDSLKEMFKSNLSITKNLPILLKREGDFRELIYYIEPLIESTDVGMRRMQMLERCIADGNNIYAILKNIFADIEKDIEVWTKEKDKSLIKQKELNFEKDNLPYVQLIREEAELNDSMEESLGLKEEISKTIDELLEKERRYKVSELLLEKKDLHNKESGFIKKRDILRETLKVEETEEEIKTLDEIIKAKWEETRLNWEKISRNHYSYINYLKNKNNKLEKVKAKENNDILQKNIEIKLFEDKEKALERNKGKLEEVFDPFRMAMPEILISELREQYDEEYQGIEDLEKDITENENQKDNALALQTENKVKIDILEKQIKEQEKLLKDVKEKEEGLKQKICSQLNLDFHKEVYRESWLENQNYQLSKLIEEKKELLEEQKLELWENNLDKSLNTEDYWIPNKDTVSIKDKINDLGISVQLGTEYMSLREEKERTELIEKYPMLPYGLLIANEKDWQIIKDNLTESLFLRSYIPVFVRSQMKATDKESFKTIESYGIRLAIEADEYANWLKEIRDKDAQIAGNIKILADKIGFLEKLVMYIENQLKSKSSLAIIEEIEDNKGELDTLKDKKNILYNNLEEIAETMKRLKKNKAQLENKHKNTEKDIEKLNEYINKLKEIEKERVNVESLKKEISLSMDKVETIKKDILYTDEKIKGYSLDYEKWLLRLKNIIKDIQDIIVEASFDDKKYKEEFYENETVPKYYEIDEDFTYTLNKRQSLAMEADNKNSEIIAINKDIEYTKIDIERLEKQLDKIDVKWADYKEISETKDMHRVNLENILKELEMSKTKKQEIHDSITEMKVKLDGIRKDKRKIEKSLNEIYGRAPLHWEHVDLVQKEYEIVHNIIDNESYLTKAEGILKDLDEKKMKTYQVISDIKAYRELDSGKGKVDEYIMEEIKQNPHDELGKWVSKYNKIKDDLNNNYNQVLKDIDDFGNYVRGNIYDEILKSRILQHITNIKIERYKSNLESFKSMKEHFQKEINTIATDKEKAEEVREQWAQRAARHAIKIIESLKEMIAGMNFVNENNHVFPLVSLKGEEMLPKEEEEIIYGLKEYFVESISKLLKENEEIESIDEKIIDNLMGDQAIFARAVGGRHPKLMVYKMTEKNEFRYAKPRDYYYTSWEAINKGEGDAPEGSGGQTLSVNTFVIMMLMNYRKRYIGNKRPWTVLLLDNPFGKASGKHVLDPIFEIADKLNFQIIALAAPEIIKAEISERFPIFWELKIQDTTDYTYGTVTGEMIHGGRVNKM